MRHKKGHRRNFKYLRHPILSKPLLRKEVILRCKQQIEPIPKDSIPQMTKEELDEWAHKLKVHELPVFTPYLVEHTEFIEGCIEPEFHDNKLTGFSLCKPINVGNRIGDVIRGHRLTDRESEDSAYAESMKHYTFDGTVYDRKDDENEQ